MSRTRNSTFYCRYPRLHIAAGAPFVSIQKPAAAVRVAVRPRPIPLFSCEAPASKRPTSFCPNFNVFASRSRYHKHVEAHHALPRTVHGARPPSIARARGETRRIRPPDGHGRRDLRFPSACVSAAARNDRGGVLDFGAARCHVFEPFPWVSSKRPMKWAHFRENSNSFAAVENVAIVFMGVEVCLGNPINSSRRLCVWRPREGLIPAITLLSMQTLPLLCLLHRPYAGYSRYSPRMRGTSSLGDGDRRLRPRY